MYSKIIACVDGSYDSEVAAKYAMGLAHESGATLIFLHVKTEKDVDASASIGRLERIAARRGIQTDIEYRKGDQFDQIRKAVRKTGADVVVASSGGKVKEHGILSGNLAYDLIQGLDVTVFVIKSVRGTTAKEHNKILCPIQSVTPSLSERAYALDMLSRLYKSPISLLRCYRIQEDRYLTKEEQASIFDKMRNYVSPLTEELAERGVRTYLFTRICYSIKGSVLDFLERNKYDLLFLRVTPGRFFRFTRKDFAIEVMKSSECNVILWKPRAQ